MVKSWHISVKQEVRKKPWHWIECRSKIPVNSITVKCFHWKPQSKWNRERSKNTRWIETRDKINAMVEVSSNETHPIHSNKYNMSKMFPCPPLLRCFQLFSGREQVWWITGRNNWAFSTSLLVKLVLIRLLQCFMLPWPHLPWDSLIYTVVQVLSKFLAFVYKPAIIIIRNFHSYWLTLQSS